MLTIIIVPSLNEKEWDTLKKIDIVLFRAH